MHENVDPPLEIRNPQLVKLYADLQKKPLLLGFWLNFCVLTIIIYLLTLAVPTAMLTQTNTSYGCPPGVYNSYTTLCSQLSTSLSPEPEAWLGYINLTPLNQIMLVQASFMRNSTLLQNQQLSVMLNVSIGVLVHENGDYVPVSNNSLTVQIDCLDSSKTECSDTYLAYFSSLSQSGYFFVIDFSNNTPDISTWSTSYQIQFVTVNPEYSKFLLALRYVLVGFSVLANFLYIRRLRMIPYSDVVIEQKMLFVIGLLLILFNDPFAGLTVLYPSLAGSFFSVFFTVNFIIMVLLFWLVSFERIWRENDQKETKSLTIYKMLFVGLIWIFLFIPYVLLSAEQVSNPMFGIDQSLDNAYQVFKYLGLVLIAIYCGTILSYYIRVCKVYDSRLWRHKTLFIFSNYFIFAMLICRSILLVLCILNMYIYFMQFMYTPTFDGIKESIRFISQEKEALKYNVFDRLDDKEEDINIDFGGEDGRNPQGERLNEIEIYQTNNNKRKPLGVIAFNQEEESEQQHEKIEDLNESSSSRQKKSEVFG